MAGSAHPAASLWGYEAINPLIQPRSLASQRKAPLWAGLKADKVRHLKSPVSPSSPMHSAAVRFRWNGYRSPLCDVLSFVLRRIYGEDRDAWSRFGSACTGNPHAAALPSSVMNSRRLMGCPQAKDHTLPYCEKSALCITAKSAARLPRWVRLGQTDHLAGAPWARRV